MSLLARLVASRIPWAAAAGIAVCLGLGGGCRPPAEEPPAAESRAGQQASAPLASRPLEQRRPSSGPRFALVSPAETGVDFRFTWDPQTLKGGNGLGSAGAAAGVCIGDYDADGRPDLFLTRPFGGNRLYRNLGGFRFDDVTQQAGLSRELEHEAWGAGPCFIDIDNDKDLDLYVCSHRRANRLWVNQGDGTFREQAKQFGLDYSGASIAMAFCDYDNDGDLDAYLVTNRLIRNEELNVTQLKPQQRAGRMRVAAEYQQYFDVVNMGPPGSGKYGFAKGAELDHFYRNDDGKFVEATEEVLGEAAAAENYFGHAVRWFDYNRDGHPDLYVANDFFGPDQLFRNNGAGTMTDVTRETLPHLPWYSMGCDAGDVNNDGRFDLLASDMAFTTHFKSKVNMGDMADSAWFLDHSDPKQQMANALFVNTGTGRFLETAAMAGVAKSDWTWAIKFADFDEDGRTDVYITNGYTRNWFDSDLRNREKLLNNGDARTGADDQAAWDAIWKNEPPLREENLALRNAADLKFEKVSRDWGLGFEGASFGSALGDLDGDGDLDIVTVNFEDPAHIYRNNTQGAHRIALQLQGTKSNRMGVGAVVEVEAGGVTQLRDLAAARGFMSADQPLLHFGLGEQQSIDRLTIYWPSGLVQQHTNLPADQLYTVTESPEAERPEVQPEPEQPLFAAMASAPEVLHEESDFDDFAQQPLLPNRLSRLGPGLACGDVNGDGLDDFYVAGAKGQAGKLLLGKPGGKLRIDLTARFVWDATDSEEMAPLFFDADTDGDLDLYIVHGGNEDEPGAEALQDRLYLNDGAGRFEPADDNALPDMTFSGGVVAAADYDHDGDLDLFVGGRVVPGQYPSMPRSALLRNDRGAFTDVTEQAAPGLANVGMVTSALWSDASGNGWQDLLVTCEWGPVSLWRNNDGQLTDATRDAGLQELTGWWNGIASGDIDHDGDMDYVVTNFGLNTKYHTSHHHPAVIYYGDMDDNGQKDIIEAKFVDAELFPVRGKSCSTNAIPSLGDKIGTFHEFASLALDDIYGDNKLESAQRLEATTLESGLLINQGDGVLEFKPLPRIAQVSPGFGSAIFDANADGHNDVYLVQNFYSPQRETIRMDGGVSQLLLGDGSGNLTPAPFDRQGAIIPGDAKALAIADISQDGAPDLLVTQNNGPLLAFANQPPPGGAYLRVRLRGPAGNHLGVGARVTVALADGGQSVREVASGGGYLSQSSATQFFAALPGNPATAIRVRWPDGHETTVAVSPGDKQVEVAYDR